MIKKYFILFIIFTACNLACCIDMHAEDIRGDFNKINRSRELTKEAAVYYGERDYDKAKLLLKEAIDYDPDNAPALELMGEISYYVQDLKSAESYWKKALLVSPSFAGLKDRLEELESEKKHEKNTDKLAEWHFEIRLEEGVSSYDIYKIRDILREAYKSVGNDLGYFPQSKVAVLIYSKKNYEKLAQAPEWSAGIYDGKIRIPVPENEKEYASIKCIIWHEYTHVLVRDLTSGNCPAWLNEGLAGYEESKIIKRGISLLKNRLDSKKALISLADLTGGFDKFGSSEDISLAYEESYSAIDYIVKKYGFWRVKKVLKRLKDGDSINKVFQDEFGFDMAQFEKKWYNYLK